MRVFKDSFRKCNQMVRALPGFNPYSAADAQSWQIDCTAG